MSQRESQPDIDFRSWVPTSVIPGTPYELLEASIGEGGYGRIYKVRHAETGRICALKALNRELIGRRDVAERLRQEVRAIAQLLPHPNLVEIYDAGHTLDHRYYYVMELLEGQDFRRLINQHRRRGLPAERACTVVRQVVSALAKAHAYGIIHRDVKPDNIFLATNVVAGSEVVKLLDFGVAKVFSSDGVRTAPGVVIGTLHYFAPENVQGAPISPLTDIYAVGVTLWEALTGEHPFPHASQFATLSAIVEQGVPPLETMPLMAELVPPDVCAIVRRATEIDPSKRFPSALAFLDALERVSYDRTPVQRTAPLVPVSPCEPATLPAVTPRIPYHVTTRPDVVAPIDPRGTTLPSAMAARASAALQARSQNEPWARPFVPGASRTDPSPAAFHSAPVVTTVREVVLPANGGEPEPGERQGFRSAITRSTEALRAWITPPPTALDGAARSGNFRAARPSDSPQWLAARSRTVLVSAMRMAALGAAVVLTIVGYQAVRASHNASGVVPTRAATPHASVSAKISSPRASTATTQMGRAAVSSSSSAQPSLESMRLAAPSSSVMPGGALRTVHEEVAPAVREEVARSVHEEVARGEVPSVTTASSSPPPARVASPVPLSRIVVPKTPVPAALAPRSAAPAQRSTAPAARASADPAKPQFRRMPVDF